MKISKRLEKIITLVEEDTNVIDVGCDHALIDIYLTLNKKNTCIATDINKNALEIPTIKKSKIDGTITLNDPSIIKQKILSKIIN